VKQADLRDIFNMISESVCISTTVASPAPSTSSATKNPGKTEEERNNPEPAEGVSKQNIPQINCAAQV
jgi:hypothetical protein